LLKVALTVGRVLTSEDHRILMEIYVV